MAGETDNTDELLSEARAAMHDYDPEDGESIDSPAWRLLLAFEHLDRLLSGGASLPAAWSEQPKPADESHSQRAWRIRREQLGLAGYAKA